MYFFFELHKWKSNLYILLIWLFFSFFTWYYICEIYPSVVAGIHLSLRLYVIPLCEYTRIYFSILQFMDICVASSLGMLLIVLFWQFFNMSFGTHGYWIWLPGVKMLGSRIYTWLVWAGCAIKVSMVVAPVYTLTKSRWISVTLYPCLHEVLFSFF